ncbi:MAG: hypothetical protein Q4D52_04620 [Eubacteriales bacterium]|nr:hypothetical protein [Eubacteriales bacterium]
MKTRNKWLKQLLIIMLLLTFVPLMRVSAEEDDSSVLAAMIFQPYQVYISEENFPDSNFRQFVEQYDIDHNLILDIGEREAVQHLYGNEKNFASLKGIEYFPELLELYCAKNQLTELDLRANPKLSAVYCSRNQLTKLRFASDCKLRSLGIQYNQLESVDITGMTDLIYTLMYGHNGETSDWSVEVKYSERGEVCSDMKTDLIFPAGRWIKDNIGWWFADSAGLYPIDEWRNLPLGSGTARYLFDEKGYMRTGWVERIIGWYYFCPQTGFNLGRMLTGWQEVDGQWYYLGEAEDEYLGLMRTGWQKINGQWYYLGSSGVMRTGWQKISGAWYLFDRYGKMQTGWKWDQGHWYYLQAKSGEQLGQMQTGWQKIDGAWYYFEKKGTKSHPQGAMYAGEKTPDGYTVNASGVWVW